MAPSATCRVSAAAAISMGSNDTLTVSVAPSPMPFWPSGENVIGKVAGSASPPANLTVNLVSGVLIGYASTDKGVFDIENNGTTINGNSTGSGTNSTIFWVNPGNNLACFRVDLSLDTTIKHVSCQQAENGSLGPDARFGTFTVTDVDFNNGGCSDAGCILGRDHGAYFGGCQGYDCFNGLDNLLVSDSLFRNTQEEGWNIKNRGPNSTYI